MLQEKYKIKMHFPIVSLRLYIVALHISCENQYNIISSNCVERLLNYLSTQISIVKTVNRNGNTMYQEFVLIMTIVIPVY